MYTEARFGPRGEQVILLWRLPNEALRVCPWNGEFESMVGSRIKVKAGVNIQRFRASSKYWDDQMHLERKGASPTYTIPGLRNHRASGRLLGLLADELEGQWRIPGILSQTFQLVESL